MSQMLRGNPGNWHRAGSAAAVIATATAAATTAAFVGILMQLIIPGTRVRTKPHYHQWPIIADCSTAMICDAFRDAPWSCFSQRPIILGDVINGIINEVMAAPAGTWFFWLQPSDFFPSFHHSNLYAVQHHARLVYVARAIAIHLLAH